MKQKQTRFLQAMLEESSITKASESAGISRFTAYRYLEDAGFKEELNRRRNECIADAVRFLQGKLTRCAEELIHIIDDPDVSEQVKINAVNAVFSSYKNLGEQAEVQERLAQIEAMLADIEGGGRK